MPGRYIYLNRYAGSTAALLNIAPADQGADGDVERIGFWPSTKWEGMRVMPQLLQTIYEIAVEKGRKTRPNLKLGICGEHGGNPNSIYFCHKAGLDYVSCSPYRVPIARLSAAKAALN